MLNQAKPASASGWQVGDMLVARLPPSNPPPCTRIAAGNGPEPSGTCRSRSSAWPPGLPYSTPVRSSGGGRIAAAAQITVRSVRGLIAADCITPLPGGPDGDERSRANRVRYDRHVTSLVQSGSPDDLDALG